MDPLPRCHAGTHQALGPAFFEHLFFISHGTWYFPFCFGLFCFEGEPLYVVLAGVELAV